MALTSRAPLRVSSSPQVSDDALDRGVRVQGSDNDLQLRVDPGLLLGVGTDKRDRANSFTVQTQVLGERLAEQELVALLNKVSERKGVFEDVSRREALVRLRVSSATGAATNPPCRRRGSASSA